MYNNRRPHDHSRNLGFLLYFSYRRISRRPQKFRAGSQRFPRLPEEGERRDRTNYAPLIHAARGHKKTQAGYGWALNLLPSFLQIRWMIVFPELALRQDRSGRFSTLFSLSTASCPLSAGFSSTWQPITPLFVIPNDGMRQSRCMNTHFASTAEKQIIVFKTQICRC
jgi:hypothetical protein